MSVLEEEIYHGQAGAEAALLVNTGSVARLLPFYDIAVLRDPAANRALGEKIAVMDVLNSVAILSRTIAIIIQRSRNGIDSYTL